MDLERIEEQLKVKIGEFFCFIFVNFWISQDKTRKFWRNNKIPERQVLNSQTGSRILFEGNSNSIARRKREKGVCYWPDWFDSWNSWTWNEFSFQDPQKFQSEQTSSSNSVNFNEWKSRRRFASRLDSRSGLWKFSWMKMGMFWF